MAYRMMTSVPEVADISNEPETARHVRAGSSQAWNLRTKLPSGRRLAERDVRFISIMHVGWDHHTNIPQRHPPDCKMSINPRRLGDGFEQRGLLKDTLVMWGSEFGRTSSHRENTINVGRDHHGNNSFGGWRLGVRSRDSLRGDR